MSLVFQTGGPRMLGTDGAGMDALLNGTAQSWGFFWKMPAFPTGSSNNLFSLQRVNAVTDGQHREFLNLRHPSSIGDMEIRMAHGIADTSTGAGAAVWQFDNVVNPRFPTDRWIFLVVTNNFVGGTGAFGDPWDGIASCFYYIEDGLNSGVFGVRQTALGVQELTGGVESATVLNEGIDPTVAPFNAPPDRGVQIGPTLGAPSVSIKYLDFFVIDRIITQVEMDGISECDTNPSALFGGGDNGFYYPLDDPAIAGQPVDLVSPDPGLIDSSGVAPAVDLDNQIGPSLPVWDGDLPCCDSLIANCTDITLIQPINNQIFDTTDSITFEFRPFWICDDVGIWTTPLTFFFQVATDPFDFDNTIVYDSDTRVSNVIGPADDDIAGTIFPAATPGTYSFTPVAASHPQLGVGTYAWRVTMRTASGQGCVALVQGTRSGLGLFEIESGGGPDPETPTQFQPQTYRRSMIRGRKQIRSRTSQRRHG